MLSCEWLVEQLRRWDIDTFFVLTGGAIAPCIDAVARCPGVKYYCFQHEQAASMAADGYHRATGRLACVLVTSGPGAQNVMNGLCGCYYDSVPALFVSGQVNMRESLDAITATPRQVGFQETPVVECYKLYTKFAAKVKAVEALAGLLHTALVAAKSGRKGPVLLDYPVNVQMSDLDAPFSDALPVAPWSGPAPAVDVVALLRASKRPVVMLGEGSRGAAASVRALVARLGLPFTCSWAGLDLCGGGGGLFVGPHGVYGARAANFAIQNADLLLVLGARLDTRQTGGNLAAFSRESVKVVVDIDGQETARLAERGLAVTAVTSDVGAFVAHLLARPELPTGELPVAEWRATVAGWGAKYGEEAHPPTAPHACAYSVLRQLDALMPPDAVVAIDTGATLVWCFQTLAPSGSRRIFSNLGNSSMGFSLPAAIGAAIGRPDLPVICIIGDGGAQQNIQELVTVAHYRLNVKVFVFNNSGYGIIKQFQTSYLQGRLVATERGDLYGVAGGVDFSAVAAAYGVPARRVTAEAPLAAEEVTKPGFALFDVVVHESQGIQPKTDFGNSLDNMSPFLDSAGDMVVPPPPRVERSGWIKV